MMKILYILFGLNITVTIVSFVFHWNILGFVFLFISICTIYLLLFVKSINEDNSNCNNKDCDNYVYLDYESEPGFWAHNDSLFCLIIYRKDDVVLNEDNNTDEGWSIVNKTDSEPKGACLEEENTVETRNNGVTIQYYFSWKKKFKWLLQHDIVRMLYDKKYFNAILSKAENGDADSQTLIGCCYGHNGKQSSDVVEHNMETALSWWHKAAEQGHKYAMRELAIYHWHRKEQDKATYWWNKGELDIFIIGYTNNYQYKEIDE